jgi:hypothetical protein
MGKNDKSRIPVAKGKKTKELKRQMQQKKKRPGLAKEFEHDFLKLSEGRETYCRIME